MANIILYENWLECLQFMDNEDKTLYLGLLARARMGEELDLGAVPSPTVRVALGATLSMVNRANEKRDEFAKNMGSISGNRISDFEIWQCANSHPNWTAKQVGEELGISAAKVYHSLGWEKRKENFFF